MNKIARLGSYVVAACFGISVLYIVTHAKNFVNKSLNGFTKSELNDLVLELQNNGFNPHVIQDIYTIVSKLSCVRKLNGIDFETLVSNVNFFIEISENFPKDIFKNRFSSRLQLCTGIYFSMSIHRNGRVWINHTKPDYLCDDPEGMDMEVTSQQESLTNLIIHRIGSMHFTIVDNILKYRQMWKQSEKDFV